VPFSNWSSEPNLVSYSTRHPLVVDYARQPFV